jgi:ribosomal protein S16
MGTRERESLLKLVIGMAVGGYGYDPTAARSEQPAAIADDLSTNGVSLDVDTVRKWLKAGAEQLPQLKTERY